MTTGVYRKERGESRAIYVAVTDDPDFLSLSRDAKLLWYTLKMRMGASGIDAIYPGQLADLTGISYDAVDGVLSELEGARWIVRERNVVWLRNGLRFDPYMSTGNRRHLSAVCGHLSGLPKYNIINEFCSYYNIDPEWVSQGVPDTHSGTPPDTLPGTLPDRLPDTGSRNKELGGKPKEKNPSGSKRKKPMVERPPDWCPNTAHVEKARKHGLDVEYQAQKFKQDRDAKGVLYADWGMAFHTWLDNAAEFKARDGPPKTEPKHTRSAAEVRRIYGEPQQPKSA